MGGPRLEPNSFTVAGDDVLLHTRSGKVIVTDAATWKRVQRDEAGKLMGWNVQWFPSGKTGKWYAVGNGTFGGQKGRVMLHWAIAGTKLVDHEDGDTMNNRSSNLRASTPTANAYNAVMNSRNTSGFRGVSFHHGKFYASFRYKGRDVYVGAFDRAEVAALARDMAMRAILTPDELRSVQFNFPEYGGKKSPQFIALEEELDAVI